MKYRRRQRWLRRLALGFAFATALFAGKVSPALAVADEGGAGTKIVSAGVPSGGEIASQDPYLTDVFVRQGEALGGPDGGAQTVQSTQHLSPVIRGEALETRQPVSTGTRPDDRADRFAHSVVATPSEPASVRPDNRADRFAHSDVAARPELSSSGWNVEWGEALSIGIGVLVLGLALGLGLGYLRRPKLAL